MPVFHDQTVAMRLYLHTALRQGRMQIPPGCCRIQGAQYLFTVFSGVSIKRLLAGVRLHQAGFLVPALTGLLGWVDLDAVIHGQPEFPLRSPADLVAYPEIAELLVACIFFGIDHVVRNVHVQIARVLVNAAMTLMLGIAERGGEVLLYGLECLRRELGLVFGPETDDQMIGFAGCAGIPGLHVHGLRNALGVVIAAEHPLGPAHQALFSRRPGIGDVGCKAGIVVVARVYEHALADHAIGCAPRRPGVRAAGRPTHAAVCGQSAGRLR